MAQERIKINKYESNPEWDNLKINYEWENWTISSHNNGDVEIEVCDDDGCNYLFLNQDELKQVIEFLQSKVR